MRKRSVATTLMVAAFFAIPAAASADGGAASSTAPQCPISASSGVTVVPISAELMLASDAAKASAGPVAVTLAPGTYDVTLYSWDAHSTKAQQTQTKEQWKLELWDGGATPAITTAATQDLPENTDLKDYQVGTVILSQAVTAVRAVHDAYPDVEPHSVAPICAVFIAQGTSGGTASAGPPQCPQHSSTAATVVNISSELMLAWDEATASAGPVPVSLAPGTYEVSVYSWDAHSTKSHQAQTKEQWYLELWAAGATTPMISTAATPDLPENVDLAGYNMGMVTLTEPLAAVRAVHAAYPDPFEPHSVAPLCAVFVGVGTSSAPGVDNDGGENGTTGDGDNGTTGDTTGGGENGPTGGTTGGGENGTTGGGDDAADVGVLGGTASQSLQQLPLTGIEIETGFIAFLALLAGILLINRSQSWQSRLERRNARVWRRPVRL